MSTYKKNEIRTTISQTVFEEQDYDNFLNIEQSVLQIDGKLV